MPASFSSEMARLQLERSRAISDGTVTARAPRSPRTTTPTPFETFAAELARTVEAA